MGFGTSWQGRVVLANRGWGVVLCGMRAFSLLMSVLLVGGVGEAAFGAEKMTVYFGTYTGGNSKGIYSCELSLKDGSLGPVKLAAEKSESFVFGDSPDKAISLFRERGG